MDILGNGLLEIVAESNREKEKGQWKGGQPDKEVSRRRKQKAQVKSEGRAEILMGERQKVGYGGKWGSGNMDQRATQSEGLQNRTEWDI